LKLNQILVYADDDNILGGSVHTIKKNIKALVVADMETELEVMLVKLNTCHVSRSECRTKPQYKNQ
jgi:hypothetical protein